LTDFAIAISAGESFVVATVEVAGADALEPPIVGLLTLSLRDAFAEGAAGAGATGFEDERDDPLIDEDEDREDEDEDRELLPLPEATSTPLNAMATAITRTKKYRMKLFIASFSFQITGNIALFL
jgi:hypothetical protein